MKIAQLEDYIYLLELSLREVGCQNMIDNAQKIINSGVDLNRVTDLEEQLLK